MCHYRPLRIAAGARDPGCRSEESCPQAHFWLCCHILCNVSVNRKSNLDKETKTIAFVWGVDSFLGEI